MYWTDMDRADCKVMWEGMDGHVKCMDSYRTTKILDKSFERTQTDSAEHCSQYSDQNLVNACNARGDAWHCLALSSMLIIAQDHCLTILGNPASSSIIPPVLFKMFMPFFPGARKSYKLPLCAIMFDDQTALIYFLLC